MLETPGRIEPCFLEGDIPAILSDLVVEIKEAAANLGQGLHKASALELSDLVRIMNCYYSNLIEGHNTRPRDIEAALSGAELDEATRPLALEARAHVLVQREIDLLHFEGRLPIPTDPEFISWIHARFYEAMPDEFRFIERSDGSRLAIMPGAMRIKEGDEVVVGRHHPPSALRVCDFMDHFAKRYRSARSSATNRIIAIAAAHHRLNYIHPFMDGNGRVRRLMSHAMALDTGIGGHGLWSVSRGLARGLHDRTEYKAMLTHADMPRQGALDGRGNLSEKALVSFCEWFLGVVLDQIRFSNEIFKLDLLEQRYRRLVSDVIDDKRGPDVISAILKYGEMQRGEINMITKTSDRTARKTLGDLESAGFVKSDSPKTPVRIAFPLYYRERLFPNLFTDAEITVAPAPFRQ